MQIGQITPKINTKITNFKHKDSPKTQTESNTANFSVYPGSYYISFGARKINNQDIIEGAPYEVARCLKSIRNDSRYTQLISSDDGLYTIHQKVYEGLNGCKTIGDTKRKFPGLSNEFGVPCSTFINLCSLKDIKSPKTPLVKNLKEIENKGIKILSNGDDVPVYLLRKLLLEGKSYKDTMSDFEKDLTEEARKRINVDITGHADVMKDFGVKMPDGLNYMATLRASANPTKTMELLNSIIQSQELTELIPRALESKDPRARISMMYAWNQCPDIREDLSQFLHYNIGNPAFLADETECDIYSSDFHKKMSGIMKEFWYQYPEYNIKLSEEISKAYAEYDKHSKTPEELNQFIEETERKSEKIRSLIKTMFESEKEHKIGKDLLLHISKTICSKNPHIAGFINDEFIFDFYKLLLKNTTNRELQILEGSKDSKGFTDFIKINIPQKAKQVKNSPDYKMLMEAQKFSYLKEAENKLSSKDKINSLYSLNDNDLMLLIISALTKREKPECAKLPVNPGEISMEEVYKQYSTIKQPTGSRAKHIGKTIMESIPSNTADEEKVNSLISRYPQFLLELRNKELPIEKQHVLLSGFWEVYDMENQTDYRSVFENTFSSIQSQKEKEGVQFDFDCEELIGDIF